jgi:hypothetical protein
VTPPSAADASAAEAVPADFSAHSGDSTGLSRKMKMLKVVLLCVLLAAAGVGAGIAYKLGAPAPRAHDVLAN